MGRLGPPEARALDGIDGDEVHHGVASLDEIGQTLDLLGRVVDARHQEDFAGLAFQDVGQTVDHTEGIVAADAAVVHADARLHVLQHLVDREQLAQRGARKYNLALFHQFIEAHKIMHFHFPVRHIKHLTSFVLFHSHFSTKSAQIQPVF